LKPPAKSSLVLYTSFPIFFHIFPWFPYDFPINTLSKQLDELGSRALDCQSPAPWRESSHPYQPKLLWKMVRSFRDDLQLPSGYVKTIGKP